MINIEYIKVIAMLCSLSTTSNNYSSINQVNLKQSNCQAYLLECIRVEKKSLEQCAVQRFELLLKGSK